MSTLRAFGLWYALTGLGVAQVVGVGYEELVRRLGPTAPTGSGVVVGQVEAGSPVGYGPDVTISELNGKEFVLHSGPTSAFGHATEVARHFYGGADLRGSLSVAPGIRSVHLWNASDWIQNGYLRAHAAATTPPAAAPVGVRVVNNSWIGTAGSWASDNVALRRADFASVRDGVLFVNGVNNGVHSSNPPLMSQAYNGLAVGRSDGNHGSGPTPSALDGPGRMKPEIVAPASATSFATPIVASVASLMVETARTHPSVAGNTNAERPLVTKAVVLAGAQHRPGWSNQNPESGLDRGETITPLDPVFGVDVVNADRSHRILTGGEQGGDPIGTLGAMSRPWGWDHAAVAGGRSLHWFFQLSDVQLEVSVIATWDRRADPGFSSSRVADFDLRLHRVDDRGHLQPLTGMGGAPFFAGGNVVSRSPVDNVEHLYLNGLVPGTYALVLERVDGSSAPVAAAVAWHFDGPSWNGTGEDLDLLVHTNDAADPRSSHHSVTGDEHVRISLVSPLGTFEGALPYLGVQIFPTGTMPESPTAFLHLDPTTVLFVVDGLVTGPFSLPGRGLTLGFDVPSALLGSTARVQGLVFSTLANNRSFATTPAREMTFQ